MWVITKPLHINGHTVIRHCFTENKMLAKQSWKGNKSLNPEENNTASREANEEINPLFISFFLHFYKAINTERSACSNTSDASPCSAYGNKWTFCSF